ncbi:hypothetical protein [Lacticigenium naphthae]|uniref:hypothetical protein n=1 Tax=Lacticigenium naphthae TaxID=515351 RepID=UPI000415031E|nr:hypothetical protein [Lacticigenium naphthae]
MTKQQKVGLLIYSILFGLFLWFIMIEPKTVLPLAPVYQAIFLLGGIVSTVLAWKQRRYFQLTIGASLILLLSVNLLITYL